MREALLGVYNDKLMIWNEGILSENLTIENLIKKHASKPYKQMKYLVFIDVFLFCKKLFVYSHLLNFVK